MGKIITKFINIENDSNLLGEDNLYRYCNRNYIIIIKGSQICLLDIIDIEISHFII